MVRSLLTQFLACLALMGTVTVASAQVSASTPAYCQQQRGVCRTLCSQVTPASSPKRGICDGGCDQSVRTCLTSGSYNFAPVEQYMPEFHKQ